MDNEKKFQVIVPASKHPTHPRENDVAYPGAGELYTRTEATKVLRTFKESGNWVGDLAPWAESENERFDLTDVR